MSRAYRISVKESSTREIKGEDEICTTLEILEVLPEEQMSELLRRELLGRGYAEGEDGLLRKVADGVTVTVNPCSGEVSVKSQVSEEVTIEAKREAQGYDDVGPSPEQLKDITRQQLQMEIEKKAQNASAELQVRAKDELEKKVAELQPELSEIVNKVTREALKQKAAQMGTVKEISEDAESGSLTIKIEV